MFMCCVFRPCVDAMCLCVQAMCLCVHAVCFVCSRPVFRPCVCVFTPCVCVFRLEADVKRLKADLQGSRNSEQELRSQVHNTQLTDKALKTELYQLRQDNESLQNK